jgi:drug/metabolite transporter (DMT)-like permease
MRIELAISIPAALLAAGTFAVSAVLQQRAARKTPDDESLSWRLIVDLLHRSSWIAGMACVVAAYLLQALAFAYAPVAIVEPVVGIEIVLAIPLAARLRRVKLGPREWAGAACVVAGVGSFLALSQATGGNAEPALSKWLAVGLPTVVAFCLAAFLGRASGGPRRPVLLAVSAGLAFGLTALLTQSAVRMLATGGVLSLLASWQVYALAVIGPVAFTVAQSAYQAGPLAMSLPVIDSLEPTASVILASFAFGQHIDLQGATLAGEIIGAAIAILGIFLLGHSPLVICVYERTEQERAETARSHDQAVTALADASGMPPGRAERTQR